MFSYIKIEFDGNKIAFFDGSCQSDNAMKLFDRCKADNLHPSWSNIYIRTKLPTCVTLDKVANGFDGVCIDAVIYTAEDEMGCKETCSKIFVENTQARNEFIKNIENNPYSAFTRLHSEYTNYYTIQSMRKQGANFYDVRDTLSHDESVTDAKKWRVIYKPCMAKVGF